jgi:protein-tyrosine-phosphatase
MTENSVYKVLLVCTGNTCRTAMAEGIGKHVAAEKGAKNIAFSSAGTSAAQGMPATDYAIAAAAHWDIDISGHRARLLNPELIKDADLILAMGPEHAQVIINFDRNAVAKTYLYKGFPVPFHPSQPRVDDPIGGSLEMYNQTFLELDEIMRRVFPKIVELAQNNA